MPSIADIWQQYLNQGGKPDATAFGVWLIRQAPALDADADAPVPMTTGFTPDANGYPAGYDAMDRTVRSAILMSRLNRFLHFLNKPALKDAGISPDEFVVLATLLYVPRATKTQLLRQCLIEIPTGSEMLKRMKQSGLILEKANPEDGRSSVISISARGRQQLLKAFQKLGQQEDALGVLSEAEKEVLLQLLNRLDLHHSHRHEIRQVSELMNGGIQ